MRFESGISIKEYRLLHLLWALPIGLILWLYIHFCRLTSRVIVSPQINQISPQSILFFIHRDYYASLLVIPELWRAFPRGTVFLGYHGFYSYVPWIWFLPERSRCCRYRLQSPSKPFAFIVDFVRRYPERLYLQYTDSRGPYGRVRESMPKLAQELDRTAYPSRVLVSRHLTLHSHQIPLPFSRIEWRLAEGLAPAKIASLGIEGARQQLQSRLDALSIS